MIEAVRAGRETKPVAEEGLERVLAEGDGGVEVVDLAQPAPSSQRRRTQIQNREKKSAVVTRRLGRSISPSKGSCL